MSAPVVGISPFGSSRSRIVVSCFDLVTDPGKVNTAHEMPATMAYLDLE